MADDVVYDVPVPAPDVPAPEAEAEAPVPAAADEAPELTPSEEAQYDLEPLPEDPAPCADCPDPREEKDPTRPVSDFPSEAQVTNQDPQLADHSYTAADAAQADAEDRPDSATPEAAPAFPAGTTAAEVLELERAALNGDDLTDLAALNQDDPCAEAKAQAVRDDRIEHVSEDPSPLEVAEARSPDFEPDCPEPVVSTEPGV